MKITLPKYNTSSAVKVKFMSQVAHHCQKLSWFLQHEETRSTATVPPPGWDAIPLQVASKHFVKFP